MLAKYPEIIDELIKRAKSGELRSFNLSSFMSDKSLEKVFAEIDRAMKFFSVYIFMERLEDDLWEDDRYTEKEEVLLCSLVEAEARKYWWDRNREHLELKLDENLWSFGPLAVNRFVEEFVRDTDLEQLARCVVVVDPSRVRVRRPPLETESDEWEEIFI